MPKVNRKGRREPSERYLRMRAAGVPVGDAVRLALSPDPDDRDKTVSAIPTFALRNHLDPKNSAKSIYGSRKPSDALLSALASELGGDVDFWRTQIWPRCPDPASTLTAIAS